MLSISTKVLFLKEAGQVAMLPILSVCQMLIPGLGVERVHKSTLQSPSLPGACGPARRTALTTQDLPWRYLATYPKLISKERHLGRPRARGGL